MAAATWLPWRGATLAAVVAAFIDVLAKKTEEKMAVKKRVEQKEMNACVCERR